MDHGTDPSLRPSRLQLVGPRPRPVRQRLARLPHRGPKLERGLGCVNAIPGPDVARRPLQTHGRKRRPVLPPMTALLLDPVFKQHNPGSGHPECPERYDAVTAALSHLDDLSRIKLRDATPDELALCHSRHYLTIAER